MKFNYSQIEHVLTERELNHLKGFLNQIDIRKTIVDSVCKLGELSISAQIDYIPIENDLNEIVYKQFLFIEETDQITIYNTKHNSQ
jgi:hypothetical protein